jgi:hypothetical protein
MTRDGFVGQMSVRQDNRMERDVVSDLLVVFPCVDRQVLGRCMAVWVVA